MVCAADTLSLNGPWTLSFWPQSSRPVTSPREMKGLKVRRVPAMVPGNVELDLQRAGLIEDPMKGSNVDGLRPWESFQWCYSRLFKAPSGVGGRRVILHFGGIDCLADVWLNGRFVGRAENMLIAHDFDVTSLLRSGRNRLEVILRSAVLEAQQEMLGTFSMAGFASSESIGVRKAPHMYGWDILPRLVSAGLWREVELHIEDETEIRNVHYWVNALDVPNRKAGLQADVQLRLPPQHLGRARARLILSLRGREVARSEQVVNTPAFRQRMEVTDAELWWPRGLGRPTLYDAELQVVDSAGLVLTGIVVSVSVTAFLLALTTRLYLRYHTLELDEMIRLSQAEDT